MLKSFAILMLGVVLLNVLFLGLSPWWFRTVVTTIACGWWGLDRGRRLGEQEAKFDD